jgi:trehalose synthase
MHEIKLEPRPLDALEAVLPAPQRAALQSAVEHARHVLAGRVTWNVNATGTGGGVAENLRTLLGYLLAGGIQARWLVLDGDEEFFAITKCLHNAIHGFGDTGELAGAHGGYRQTIAANAPDLLRSIGSGDLVVLHDPQSAGLVPPVRQAGIPVAWRSHIGRDTPNDFSIAGWEFLRPYVQDADALVFSRPQYAPDWVARERLRIIPPSIDPLAAKNRMLSDDDCLRVLAEAGLVALDGAGPSPAVQGAPPPGPEARLVVQVSRWDRLKDMPGVMSGFALARLPADVHLMLVAPSVSGVADDPEGAEVLAESLGTWERLPAPVRSRISLVSVPMDDLIQNALVVNAVQRRATVVAQKSLAEGFGLTVAEAMWKGKPMVASAVGGIQDQITDGVDGLLIADPADITAFARALERLIGDPDLAHRLGLAAHHRVTANCLDDQHVIRTAELLEGMLAATNAERAAGSLQA